MDRVGTVLEILCGSLLSDEFLPSGIPRNNRPVGVEKDGRPCCRKMLVVKDALESHRGNQDVDPVAPLAREDRNLDTYEPLA